MPEINIPRYHHQKIVGNRLFCLAPRRFRSKVGEWKHVPQRERNRVEDIPHSFRLLTWNVNFSLGYAEQRLECILRHIEFEIIKSTDGRPEPCCIQLQEVHQKAFKVIINDEWVRRYFVVVPGERDEFAELWVHGNVTLVSKDIPTVRANMLEFSANTEMGRGATIVEIRLSCAYPDDDGESTTMLRLINTHLESLSSGLEFRRRQLALVRKYVGQSEPMPTIVAGDLNCLSRLDEETIGALGFEDAWKADDDGEAGETWGFQEGTKTHYPPSRLDRILFVPLQGHDYYVSKPMIRGKDVRWNDHEKGYATDHYALLATVKMF